MTKTVQKTQKLDAESKAFYDKICREYRLTSAGTEILLMACYTLSRWRQAREILDAEGLYINKGSIIRINPVTKIENDCRLGFCRLMKELNLDEDVKDAINV